MARVIVILALMLAITAAMFAITRKSAIAPGEAASEPSATVRSTETPDAATEHETDASKSADPSAAATRRPRPANDRRDDRGDGKRAGCDQRARRRRRAVVRHGRHRPQRPCLVHRNGNAGRRDLAALGRQGRSARPRPTHGQLDVGFKAPKSEPQHEFYVSAQGKDGSTIIGPQRAIIRPPATRRRTAAHHAEGGRSNGDDTAGRQRRRARSQDGTRRREGHQRRQRPHDADRQGRSRRHGQSRDQRQACAAKRASAADGTWSLAASNPSGKSAESLRLELVDKDGATLDEADVPYKVPRQRREGRRERTEDERATSRRC